MSDNINSTVSSTKGTDKEQIIDLRPTLFIGMGGTGMEVLLRIRRRILNTLWGGDDAKFRIESLTEFPVAQFIHFDLDSGAVIDSGRSQKEDLQYNSIKFNDDEKIVETFNFEKYSQSEHALDKYPYIKQWLPLTPQKIRELGIDPSKGAGQIRSVSRLYFFDKYTKIRDKIRLKITDLKAGLTHEAQLKKLGLKMERSKFRIVVVGSVAGGTGSGSFLDMGWLTRWIAKTENIEAEVELMLFMPTGYAGANKDKTEANGYAALMELEAAMRGNTSYVGTWDRFDRPTLDSAPYNQVYIVDSGNIAQQHTKNIQDVYHMLADTLFEDFFSGDFSKRKRSVAVNQAQHKNYLYNAILPQQRFKDMKLSYSKNYSALGQSVIDTKLEALRDQSSNECAENMLKAFFKIGTIYNNQKIVDPSKTDQFMEEHLETKQSVPIVFPKLFAETIKNKNISGKEFMDFKLIDELLKDDDNNKFTNAIDEKLNERFNLISQQNFKEMAPEVEKLLKEMQRESIRDIDTRSVTIGDHIVRVRKKKYEDTKQKVKSALYKYLDNRDEGGLEYVITLVKKITDKINRDSDGLLAVLKGNLDLYSEIKDDLQTKEFQHFILDLKNNAEPNLLKKFLSDQKGIADQLLLSLKETLSKSIELHLRAKATQEATIFLQDISDWLGKEAGIDDRGNPIYTELIGEFQAGKDAVTEMLISLKRANEILNTELTKEHATLIYVEAVNQNTFNPTGEQLQEWASQAFTDAGGSQKIFEMLTDPDKKGVILSLVRRVAEDKFLQYSSQNARTENVDPLIEALDKMGSINRQEKFRKWLACAMPWVDANLTGDFAVMPDQYKCNIGVPNDAIFKRMFGEDLNSCIPGYAGITSAQLNILTTGVPGRAVCYVELSGIPLTALKGIDSWRNSYRKEAEKKSPLHTHINTLQFNHPIAPNTEEINRLANDFKHYLLAVILGVLSRSSNENNTLDGLYEFVEEGFSISIGSEREIRLDGFTSIYSEKIIQSVREKLQKLSPQALTLLAAISLYYERNVYTPALVEVDKGKKELSRGFACTIAGEIAIEYKAKAIRAGIPEAEIDSMIGKLLEHSILTKWANPVLKSNKDAYEWEVMPADDDNKPRIKYVIKPMFMEEGVTHSNLMTQIIQDTPSSSPTLSLSGQGVVFNSSFQNGVPILSPVLSSVTPIHQYYVGINGQQTGPFPPQLLIQMVQIGTIPLTSKVWRDGLAGWVEISNLPELTSLLSPVAATNLPPPLN